jgi:hypothetical protein
MKKAPRQHQTKVSDLKEGDLVDLQGDKFADPNENPTFESEYQIVESIEIESAGCIAVHFTGFDTVGFPPDHKLPVYA